MFQCPQCGASHALEQIEPCFWRPDAFLDVPEGERERRTRHTNEGCLIASADGQTLRCFVRSVLRVPIRGERTTIGWGVWAELSGQDYYRLIQSSDNPGERSAPPLPGTLANNVGEAGSTIGLHGTLRLADPGMRPLFTFDPAEVHPFAVMSREGVLLEKAFEWRCRAIHLR